MALIVKSGEARNLTSKATPDGRVLDPDLKKYVTFLTAGGAVHTVIVDLDHAAKDGTQLLEWFEHTKVGAELASRNPLKAGFKTADEVLHDADVALGFASEAAGGTTPTADQSQEGGVF